MFHLQTKKTKAFTLIEVLVALFFLFITIFAAVSLVNNALSTTQSSKQKFIAANLAQEGMEIVRNIRDSNWISERDWDFGLESGEQYAGYRTQGALAPYVDQFLKINAEGFYNYLDGSDTKFKRKITICKMGGSGCLDITTDNQIRVIVNVTWQEKGNDYNLTAVEDLYNWYNQ